MRQGSTQHRRQASTEHRYENPAGHSLGGAVAQICALDLLHAAPLHRLPQLQAIAFAAPAIGNQALAAFVERRGWQQRLTNYLLPGEILARCPSYMCIELGGPEAG